MGNLLGFYQETHNRIIIMKAVVAFLLLAMVYATSALKPIQSSECSVDAASKCVTEVGAAWDSCQDWSDPRRFSSAWKESLAQLTAGTVFALFSPSSPGALLKCLKSCYKLKNDFF